MDSRWRSNNNTYSMKPESNIAGHSVIVRDGKEITNATFASLHPAQQAECQMKVNGPHHNAKWAKDLLTRRYCEKYKRLFFGTTQRMGRKQYDGYLDFVQHGGAS